MERKGLQIIIATEKSKLNVMPGGTPVFLASNEDEQQKLATILCNILDTAAHDLENGLLIIVKH